MTLTLYIVKDETGAAVAGPFVIEAEANATAAIITARRPVMVESHTFPTTAGQGAIWPA